MEDYVSKEEAVAIASGLTGLRYVPIPTMKDMYQSEASINHRIIIYVPIAVMQNRNFHLIEISLKQFEQLNAAEKGMIIFRLEHRFLTLVGWEELKRYLCQNANRDNTVWTIEIYHNGIKAEGKTDFLQVQAFHYAHSLHAD